MKLYQTHSNANINRNNLYRVSIPELGIVRWSDEPLRYLHSSLNFSENLRIPVGTTTPDFWTLK